MIGTTFKPCASHATQERQMPRMVDLGIRLKEDKGYTPGECARCGNKVEKKNRRFNKYCSMECRSPWKACETCHIDFKPSRDSNKYCSRECMGLKRTLSIPDRVCRHCNKTFKAKFTDRTTYCSRGCSQQFQREFPELHRIADLSSPRRRYSAGSRARANDPNYENFDVFEIFARDGWRCQICKMKTIKSKRGSFHPRAPELDHIIPLSRNGTHNRINVQCTCRACNQTKKAKDIGQTRLFG